MKVQYVLVLVLVLAGGVVVAGVGDISISIDDPQECGGEVERSRHREAQEESVRSGDATAIEDFRDPALVKVQREFLEAYKKRDVETLLGLEMSLSNDHLRVEEARLKKVVESVELLASQAFSVLSDDTNPGHVWVLSVVVVRVGDRCIEDWLITEWILLDGDWYTFPEQQRVFSARRSANRYPNRRYRSKESDPPPDWALRELERRP